MSRVFTFDMEAYDWTNPVAVGMANNHRGTYQHFTGKNCIQEFVNEMMESKYRNCRFVAHNGGKYDFIPVIEKLVATIDLEGDYEIEILTKGSNDTPFFARIEDESGKPRFLQDSLALMPRNLQSLTESFVPEKSKGDFDFDEIEKWTDMEGEKRNELLRYLKRDCVSLFEVLQRFTNILMELTDGNCPPQLTVGSTAMTAYRAHFMSDNLEIPNCYEPDAEVDPETCFRKSYFGGRTEVYKKYGQNLKHYDVNSLYPYCYTKKPIPIGKVSNTGRNFPLEDTDIGGVVKIRGYVPPECCNTIPVLPYRFTPEESQAEKVIFPTGKIEGWYTAKEVRYALEVGAIENIEIVDSYASEYGYPFKEYGENLYELKNSIDKSEKPGKYKIVKFLLNSFYGKFGMERFHKSVKIGPVTKEFQEEKEMINPELANRGVMLEEEESFAPYILPRVASSITAQARIEMHKWFMKVYQKGGEVWYCDTDSIVTNIDLPEGEKLGEMDLEGELDEGIFLAPKVYAEKYNGKDGGELVKAKGMRRPQIDFETYREAWKTNTPGLIQAKWDGPRGFKAGMKQGEESWFEKQDYSRSLTQFDNKRTWEGQLDSYPVQLSTSE